MTAPAHAAGWWLRAMALVTVPAVAVGALAALTYVTLRDPGEPPAVEPPAGTPETRRAPGRSSHGPRPGEKVRSSRRSGTRDRDAESPVMEARLSSADERERLLAARDLLRRGPQALAWIHALEPGTSEGRTVLSKVELALDELRIARSAADWHRFDPDQQAEVRLDVFRRVLPAEMLREEEREFWAMRVEADRRRFGRDAAKRPETLLAELELAYVRRTLGETTEEEWRAARAVRIDAVRAWVASLHERRDVPPARVRGYEERLARFD